MLVPLTMTCTLGESSSPWQALLMLRAQLRQPPPGAAALYLVRSGATWRCDTQAGPADEVHAIALDGPAPAWAVPQGNGLGAPPPAFLRLYLPIVLAAAAAARQGRVHVTGHLAQTLDGRIACTSGDSQWIGNQANLRHAHRLRALHDAILVGRHTVERDNPQLTVRHVPGTHPKRLVLNGTASTVHHRHELNVYAGPGCTLVCNREHAAAALQQGLDVIALDPERDGRLPLPQLLHALAARGVHSLFVEGGGRTLSGFLAAGAIDLLHVHVTPRILGSGVPGFVLPEVPQIAQARRLTAEHFDLDGELLFVCRPEIALPEPRG